MHLLKYILLISLYTASVGNLCSQDHKPEGKIKINGKVYPTMVVNGDTVILANLDEMSFTSPRSFDSRKEYTRYRRYKKYAAKVYPYAKDAINIINKIEERTKHMKRSKRKKYIKLTYLQLEKNFKDQIKKLSRTQGKILIKMIEKETDKTFYNIIKKNRGRFTAFYWHQLGKFYDYDLKRGYVYGEDKVLDAVLNDFSFKDGDGTMLNAVFLKNEKK